MTNPMMSDNREHLLSSVSSERLATWCGVAAVTVAIVSILLAVLAAPWFSWTDDALSNLGTAQADYPWLFNYGLVLSGLLALPFSWRLYSAGDHPIERLGGLTLALSVTCLALVGVFPAGHPYHLPAAVAFYLGFTLSLWFHGTGESLAGGPERGTVSIWTGIVHLLAWIGWAVWFSDRTGLAIPETVGAFTLIGWVLWRARISLR